MDNLAKQLSAIRAAYMTGRVKPAIWTSDLDIQHDLEQEWRTAVSAEDEALLQKCSRYRNAALKAAREGKLPIAAYLFTTIDNVLSTQKISPIALLISQSAQEAAVAYFDYRRQDFERGTARIYRALAIDEMLENTYGYKQYHLHRIRLLLNLVRLKRRQGEGAEALSMSIALIDYLEQHISTLPFPTSWDASQLTALAFAPKNILFDLTIVEIIFLVVGQEDRAGLLIPDFHAHTHEQASVYCQLSPRSHRWLLSKQALQARNFALYFDCIQPLLAEGPDDIVFLWYGLLLDLVLVCQNLSLTDADYLVQEISSDMSSWPWSRLPATWKRLYETLPVHSHA
jgi:hypothetical protein